MDVVFAWSYRFYHWNYDHTSLVRVKMKINIRILLLTYSLWRPFKVVYCFTLFLCGVDRSHKRLNRASRKCIILKTKGHRFSVDGKCERFGKRLLKHDLFAHNRVTTRFEDKWLKRGWGREGRGFQLSPYAFSARSVSCDVTERDSPAKRKRLGTRLKGFVSKEPVILCRVE